MPYYLQQNLHFLHFFLHRTLFRIREERLGLYGHKYLKFSIMKVSFPFQFILISFFIVSCNGQNSKKVVVNSTVDSQKVAWSPPKVFGPKNNPETQISQYIRRMFQDKSGNIWFGTNGDGVCRYDGKNYVYFSPTDLRSGFGGEAVRGIIQEENGNIWFATNHGVTRFDGSKFVNFTENDGLANNQVWSILKDKSGKLWFGTEGGVSVFDGKNFTNFTLPEANLKDFPAAYPASKLINAIFQDNAGNIWFGSNGNGVYKYDGKSIENISDKNGLCNNFVQCITQDKNGNLWFGTRFGGMSRYDGKNFTTFNDKNGLKNNFVWTFYEDKSGKLWIGNAGGGLTRYDGKKFTNYMENEGLLNRFVQSLLEAKDGKFWVGTSGGAFTFDGTIFTNITKPVTDGC